MEIVLRDAEDVGVVEPLAEELEDLVLGEAGDVDLGRLEAALGRFEYARRRRPPEALQDLDRCRWTGQTRVFRELLAESLR